LNKTGKIHSTAVWNKRGARDGYIWGFESGAVNIVDYGL